MTQININKHTQSDNKQMNSRLRKFLQKAFLPNQMNKDQSTTPIEPPQVH